jgi:hypothetical protein
MSFLTPDYDYDPLQKMYNPPEGEEVAPSKIFVSKTDLSKNIREFCKDVPDAALHRFATNVAASMRLNTNVFDTVAFYKKFSDGLLHTLKTNFKELPPEKLAEIEESLNHTQILLAESLKSSNVENKYLLFLVLGLTEGMLAFENY